MPCGPHGEPVSLLLTWATGLKCTALDPVTGATKHISLQIQMRKRIPALGSLSAPTVTCWEQISPGNPWSLLILSVNSMTVWARKLLLLIGARVCGVRGDPGRVFLLTLCIEFKQEQHSCGNTLLQLWRTPREKVLSSAGVMAHKVFFPPLCLSPSGLITPRTAFFHATNHNTTMHH